MAGWDPSGKVDVFHMLEVLEIENVRQEGYHESRFSCPYPGHENGDASASAYMNLETSAWYCHGCKRKGNAVSFTASILQITPMKAKRLLRQAYDPASLNVDERRMVDEVKEIMQRPQGRPSIPENVPFEWSQIDDLLVDWEGVWEANLRGDEVPDDLMYAFDRGFSVETLEHWKFGYYGQSRRLTFPVVDHHGQLVGVKGRTVDDARQPKYLVLGDSPDAEERYGFPRYYTGSVVFGINEAMRYSDGHLIICEGELNAVALHQMGHRHAVALNGSRLTAAQARIIKAKANSATFFFDFDRAGLDGMWGRDDEDGHHPGALEVLARDLDVRLVGSFEHDAADALCEGKEAAIDELLDNATGYLTARVARI